MVTQCIAGGGAQPVALYYLVYIEVDVICLIMLGMVMTGVSSSFGRDSEVRVFKGIALSNIMLLVADIVWMLGEHGFATLSPALNWLVNIAYMTLTCCMGYLWAIYTKLRLSERGVSARWAVAAAVPFALVSFLAVSSVWTGCMFYIDSQNVYHRGAYYLIHPAVSLAYIILPSLASVCMGVREKNRCRRHDMFILASFALLPTAGTILQIRFFGVPAALAGSSMAVLMLFIGFQNVRIFNDALTGLNNRRRADEYLDSRLSAARDKRLIFFVLDIDCFKQINDRFGHAEGDRALVLTANALKAVCGARGAFLARYGGDEFCVIWETGPDGDAALLAREMQSEVSSVCANNGLACELTISVGYEEYSEGQTADNMFRAADVMLYKNKAMVHIQRAAAADR